MTYSIDRPIPGGGTMTLTAPDETTLLELAVADARVRLALELLFGTAEDAASALADDRWPETRRKLEQARRIFATEPAKDWRKAGSKPPAPKPDHCPCGYPLPPAKDGSCSICPGCGQGTGGCSP